MDQELLDRYVCRIARETRLARAARHPRARIAHHMLADAYRALVNRMLARRPRDEAAPRPVTETGAARELGFLTDVSG